jgi:DtxR family Mn-dependent transcriptional regulator
VHAEACRWEHVMSESVERRVLALLNHPTVSPYGNPIPGIEELQPGYGSTEVDLRMTAPLSHVAREQVRHVIIRRIAEPLQDDATLMAIMRRVGAMPGSTVKVRKSVGGVTIGSGGEYSELVLETAAHVLVEPLGG